MPSNQCDGLLSRMKKDGSARQLALFRMAIGAYVVWLLSSDGFALLNSLELSPTRRSLIPTFKNQPLVVEWARVTGQVAGALLFAGVLSRLSAAVAGIAFLIPAGLFYTYLGSNSGGVLYVPFATLLLACSRCGDAWSVDSVLGRRSADPVQYRWPRELGVAWFAMLYVAAAWAKLVPLQHGLNWFTGNNVRQHAVTRYLESPIYWIMERTPFDYEVEWVFVVAAVLGIALEALACVLLFTSRWNVPYLLAILSFHVGNWFLSTPVTFIPSVLAFGVLLVPPHWFGAEGVCDAERSASVADARPA